MNNFLCKRFLIMGWIVLIVFISTIYTTAFASNQSNVSKDCPPGDINNDCEVGLEEAIIALKVLAGFANDLTRINAVIPVDKTEIQSSENYIDLSGIIQLIESINFSEQDFAPSVKSMINTMVISCGQPVINNFYPFDASFQFNGAQECFGITGTIQLQSNIFDTKAYLTFDRFSFKGLAVDGKAIASISPQDYGYIATMTSDSITLAGHQLSGYLFAMHNEQSNRELLVGLKGTDTFTFGKNQVQLEGDLSYSHKGGANGTAKAIIGNYVILISFDNLVIDLKRLVPVSGVMKINGTPIDFGKN